jgi:NAD(P)-dependent dehydrogenase (short-subunit alcohol dehydrogenase family)
MPTHSDLNELRVAVTGGTSGLGLALVRNLVGRDARVAFVARNAKAVEQIANETGTCGIVGDIGRKEDTHPIALQVLSNLGASTRSLTTHRPWDPRRTRCSPTPNARSWSRRSG